MKTAFLYAGQGSQRVGMGRDLYAASPAFRKAFDAAELDFDLHALCFDGPQETLNQTQYTQPCMVAFACGVTEALFDAGIRPDYVAGLSLGEYSALEASGVFAAKAAIELAAYRGAAMASASEGVSSAMTAVTPRPKGVKGAMRFLNGLNTQMLSITSPVVLNTDCFPSFRELSSIP